MQPLEELITELKRRRLFRALGGWGLLSFAILQIYEPVMHGLHIPEWSLSAVVLALAAGFPVTVVLAWIFDLTGKGITRTPPAPAAGGDGAPLSRLRVALLLAGLGLLAAAPGLVYFFVWPGAARRLADPGAVTSRTTPSIAVLPFSDMSPGKDQEYLSDGIAEEILDGLAHVEALHVAGRTSSFSFKGKSEDLKSIAAKLGVTTLLEGSVRKEGGRIRVTAQLINAADGYHLWSQIFDRELTGVFAVEEEIAGAVVEALKVTLVGGRAPSSQARRTTRPEAHEQYLLGNRFMDQGGSQSYPHALAAYERAIALDAAYAPAWAGLASARFWIADTQAPNVAEHAAQLDRAMEAAEKAVALGPDLAEGYEARGYLRCWSRWDWTGCRADYERALALNPGLARAHQGYADSLATFGLRAEAIRQARRSVELDPLSAQACSGLGQMLLNTLELAEARRVLDHCLEIAPDESFSLAHLASLDLLERRPAQALARAGRIREAWLRLLYEALASYDLGARAASDRALGELVQRFDHDAAIQIAMVHAWRGEHDLSFRWLDRAVAQRDGGVGLIPVSVELRGIRDDPRYPALLRNLNLPVR
jgi:serine/threonine-protein kinase